MARRILLIDDEPELCGLCAQILQNAGYEVTAATEVHQALSLAEQGFDLLVSDVHLHEHSGLRFADAFLEKAKQASRRTRAVLFISGEDLESCRLTQLDSKSVHLLLKPFKGQDLQDKVHSIFSQLGIAHD